MKRLLSSLGLISLLMVSCNYQNIPQNKTLLSEKRVTNEISGGQIDTLFINLEKDRFIFASLFQLGIDVGVKVVDTQDKVIQVIDNLKYGPEFISFTTAEAGTYKILVEPFNPIAKAGKYSLGIEINSHTSNTKDELVNQLFAEFNNDFRPGAAVAIVDNGNVVFKNGFGVSDFSNKELINSSTRLNICSIGKQFTAFAIALLEKKGELSFDDDIRKYLPEIHDFDSKISIYNLLNHSSGLREITDILEISGKRSGAPFSKKDVMKLIYRQRELNFKPGSEYLYSNTGFILLAEIIERITHKSYFEWITKNIFEPLEMNNTYFYHDPNNFINDFAWSYKIDNNGSYQKEQLYKAWYVGAGNVFSTVEDMSKWLINFDYPKIGDEQLISRLGKIKVPMDKDSIDFYASGRVFSNYKGLEYYWHGGGGYGYTAQIVHFPVYKFGAIILSNFIYGGVYSKARQIADIYLSDHFTLSDPVYFDYKNPYKPVKVNESVLTDIEGKYLNDSGVITTISRGSNGLFIYTPGFDKTELYAMSDSTFFIKEVDVRVSFSRDKPGSEIKMTIFGEEQENVCKKIDKLPQQSQNLKSFEGKYYSDELNTYYTITQQGNSLVANHNLNGNIRLTYIDENFFKGDKWYFSWVKFKTSDNKEINEFSITNERVRNIRFIKMK